MKSAIAYIGKDMARLLFVSSLYLWLIPIVLLAQSPEEPRAAAPCTMKDIFNRRGWKIPGLAKTRIREASHRGNETPDLFLEVLEPVSPEDYVTIVGGALGKLGMLEVFDESVDVTEIQRFTMNDHVFGYLVIATVADNDRNGKRLYFGSQERVYYYDPDGSGRFTMMRYAGEMLFKIVIPDWVKRSKKEASAVQPHKRDR